MFRYLKKKIVGDSLSRISNAFSRVDEDLKLLQQWVSHLHTKSEDLHKSHSEHITITKKDISDVNKWLRYLHSHNTELHKYVKESTGILVELQKNYENIIGRLEKVEKGQVRTPERTSQGQLEDMSPVLKDKSKVKKTEKIQVIDKDSLTGSQIELLNIFYNSDRPLGYKDLKKIVGKKKKSIRNLIYELRDKGIKINYKPIGIRTRGFYLDKEEKIKVSGR